MFECKSVSLVLILILFSANVLCDDNLSELTVEQLLEVMSSDETRFRGLVQEMSNDELLTVMRNMSDAEALMFSNYLGERASSLPFEAFVDSGIAPKGTASMLLRMVLPSLGYPRGPKGVEDFQRDIEEEVDGVITAGQAVEMMRRYERTRDSKVHAYAGGGQFAEEIELVVYDGRVRAEGTWVSETMELAYPVNTSQVVCESARRLCYIIGAHVTVPEMDSDSSGYVLESTFDEFDIVSWTDNEVTATQEGLCRSTTLTVNLPSNEVVETTRNNWKEACEENAFAVKLPKPHVKRLMPGYPATERFWESRREQTKEFFSSSLRSAVETLADDLESGDGSSRPE